MGQFANLRQFRPPFEHLYLLLLFVILPVWVLFHVRVIKVPISRFTYFLSLWFVFCPFHKKNYSTFSTSTRKLNFLYSNVTPNWKRHFFSMFSNVHINQILFRNCPFPWLLHCLSLEWICMITRLTMWVEEKRVSNQSQRGKKNFGKAN